jgi:hypothetical protein
VQFSKPDTVIPNNIVINEILSDPKSGGEKYIELYNRSSKVLDYKTLDIASADSITGLITMQKSISSESYLIFPGDYYVLSKDGNSVKRQYYSANPDHFIDLPSMPKMNIGGGTLVLLTKSGTVIDEVTYSASWQFPLLLNSKGVALERIDYNQPSQDAGNWHSASEPSGFGTPGYKNSEWMTGSAGSGINLTDELFSPDDDGYQDVLGINYHFDKPDYVGNVSIYNSQGALIRILMRNELLGREGIVNWDGITDGRIKASIGIYIVYFEIFGADGTRKEFRHACVLAGKL